jgi:HB1, ASXL, restriction endonuclease HTH domain
MAAKKSKTDKTKDTPKPEETPKAEKSAKKNPKPKKTSALDAAAKVLGEAGQAMTCMEMIEAMSKKGLWTSPNGATPQATLYSAMLREIKTKGKEARFQKTERGKFAINS